MTGDVLRGRSTSERPKRNRSNSPLEVRARGRTITDQQTKKRQKETNKTWGDNEQPSQGISNCKEHRMRETAENGVQTSRICTRISIGQFDRKPRPSEKMDSILVEMGLPWSRMGKTIVPDEPTLQKSQKGEIEE